MPNKIIAIDEQEGVYQAQMADAAHLNLKITEQFLQAKEHTSSRQTHHFHGRFENTYVDKSLIPSLESLFTRALNTAEQILGRTDLKFGFWFNEMGPGHRTSLHSHEELDELLSAVYYITVPPNSGRLLLHLGADIKPIDPQPGMFVFFPPDLPHEVETNLSGEVRLSLAMNFGPREEEA